MGIEQTPTYFHAFLDTCVRHKDNLAFIYRAGEDEFRVTYEKFFEDVLEGRIQ